jgi:hypothetical protein
MQRLLDWCHFLPGFSLPDPDTTGVSYPLLGEVDMFNKAENMMVYDDYDVVKL